MTRFVWCVYNDRHTGSDQPCRTVSQKPVDRSTCILKPCPTAPITATTTTPLPQTIYVGIWRHGPWSQCSSSCGPGTKRRAVVCQPEGQCNPSTKPTMSESCEAGQCPRWSVSAWQPVGSNKIKNSSYHIDLSKIYSSYNMSRC